MGVLRDVLAKFTVLVDDKPLTDLDKKILKVKKNIKTFSMYAGVGFAIAGAAAWNLTKAASDANESLNVLNKTFAGNEKAVLAWSKSAGDHMGRSMYDMQDSVGKFGAFLTPVFKDSTQDVSKMSERLAELAVDLASFYNTSDQEATMRLFSGMSGETEAVRRLGIDISDTALDAFNKARGDSRTMRALTLAEKSTLRYEKILQDTTLAQGDAHDTAHDWANSLKRVEGKIKTMRVELGRKLLPTMMKLLGAFEGLLEFGMDAFVALEERTSALRTAVYMLGATAVAATVRWTLASKALWASLLKVEVAWAAIGAEVAIAAAAFIAIEDFITFLRGGDSIFGRLFTEITGLQNPLDRLDRTLQRIVDKIMNPGDTLFNMMGELLLGDQKDSKGNPLWKRRVGFQESREAELEASRQAQFNDAVDRGDLNAAKKLHSIDETPAAAYQRALQQRGVLAGGLTGDSWLDTGMSPTYEDQGMGFSKFHATQVPMQTMTASQTVQEMNAKPAGAVHAEVHIHAPPGPASPRSYADAAARAVEDILRPASRPASKAK